MEPKCEECRWYGEYGDCQYPTLETPQPKEDRQYPNDFCGPTGLLFEKREPKEKE